MTKQIVSVPDIGGADGVDVIEVSVAVGDNIDVEQAVVVLETDKASMDIPSPVAGVVTALSVNVGDKVSEGSALIEVDTISENEQATETEDSVTADNISEEEAVSESLEQDDNSSVSSELLVTVPDGAEDADVIEVCVAVGDELDEGDSLIVLETDKASMEVPAPAAGKIISMTINQGDKTVAGGEIAVMEVFGSASASAVKPDIESTPAETAEPETTTVEKPSLTESKPATSTPPESTANEHQIIQASQSKEVYAGPAVRKFAREMAVDLTQVAGNGDRGRVTKADVKAYVKQVMTGEKSTGAVGGFGIPPIPAVDFEQFGEIDLVPMSKIKKLTAENMSRNWLNIPHVTQFDDADITDLEAFRNSLKPEAEKRGVKLTPLPFLLKACAAALQAEPNFNVSLHHDGEHIVQKKYIHIGVAVDSPIGLVVPVIRDVDKKGLWELAAEFMELVGKARDGKLSPKDMQGGCFTISSLGAMGGQGFTPIVNAPEVAILAVSRAEIKPKWNGNEFEPRNMLPLSLSYDHRAINGGDAGRFFTYLNSVVADVRRLLL